MLSDNCYFNASFSISLSSFTNQEGYGKSFNTCFIFYSNITSLLETLKTCDIRN